MLVTLGLLVQSEHGPSTQPFSDIAEEEKGDCQKEVSLLT